MAGLVRPPLIGTATPTLASWKHPGPGSFYDDVGNVSKSPHLLRGDSDFVEPEEDTRPEPTFWWWDQGKSRARLSWQVTLWPHILVYEGLDPSASYVVRTTGYGQARLRIDGERVTRTSTAKRSASGRNGPWIRDS